MLSDGGTPASAHPWSAAALAPFALRAGKAPATDAELVLDASTAASTGAHTGDRLRLTLPSGVSTFTVSGIAAPVGNEPDERTVFMTDAEARTVAGHPESADVIGVIAAPGTNTKQLKHDVSALLPAVSSAADGAFPRVYTGADRGLVETPEVASAREFAVALPSVFGGCTLLIAVLVIAGTVGLSVQQRHRDIALLRAIGATPRQVRRMAVRETVLLGVVAAGLGIWPGLAGARWLRNQFVARDLTPSSFTVHVSWLPPLVAAASALFIAVIAAWIASLRPSRIRPTEALTESSVEPRRLGVVRPLLGLVALAGGIALSIVSMHVGGDNAAGIAVGIVFTLVTAVALLAGWLIRGVAAVAGLALRHVGVTGRLAAANASASARRLSPVVASLVLAVGLGGSMWFLQTSIEHRAAQQNHAGLLADHVVTPAGAGLPTGVVDAVRHTPGVAAATPVIRSSMLTAQGGGTQYSAQGIDPIGLDRTMDLGVTSGSLAGLHGDTVALGRLTADALGLHVGDTLHVWYADGSPAALHVVAVYSRGLGFAEMTLPEDVLRPHAAGLDTAVLVSTRSGRDDPGGHRAGRRTQPTGAGLDARVPRRLPGDARQEHRGERLDEPGGCRHPARLRGDRRRQHPGHGRARPAPRTRDASPRGNDSPAGAANGSPGADAAGRHGAGRRRRHRRGDARAHGEGADRQHGALHPDRGLGGRHRRDGACWVRSPRSCRSGGCSGSVRSRRSGFANNDRPTPRPDQESSRERTTVCRRHGVGWL